MSAAGLGIVASARVTGGLRFVELACFELLGRSAPECAWPAGAGFLAAAALAHAWRAGQLAELLPVSAGLPGASACTASPGPAADEAISLLCELSSAAPGAFVHAVVQLLYPALDASYAGREQSLQEASDAALARTLRRVRADLAEVRRDGGALLRDLHSAETAEAGVSGAALGAASRLALVLDPLGAPFGVQPAGAAS